jgi:hypothetical protein
MRYCLLFGQSRHIHGLPAAAADTVGLSARAQSDRFTLQDEPTLRDEGIVATKPGRDSRPRSIRIT